MTRHRWLLPEAIEDVLPQDAARMERMRRALLDEFALHGYDFVMPPLLEYVESLLTTGSPDLDLRTFKLVDQLSGRSMGVRADITPQAARIDAHLLNRKGVTRLCYCGSVLHTLPAGFNVTREPLQIGAELYGHSGLEADIEVIRLLSAALCLCGIGAIRLELGHVGIFRALVKQTQLVADEVEELFSALQGKDVPRVREIVVAVADPIRSALISLPDLQGNLGVLETAAMTLPALPEIGLALVELRRVAAGLGSLSLGIDLSDLRGYHYHTGLVFAAFCAGIPAAVALGGRYDGLGGAYGRARPATGFSMDLREVARLTRSGMKPDHVRGAILAPWPENDLVHAETTRLRSMGERVILALPGHAGSWREAGCDRMLVSHGDEWIVEPLRED